MLMSTPLRPADMIWYLPLLILDLGLHIIDSVRGLYLKRDGLAGEGLHEDLHDGMRMWRGVEQGRRMRPFA